MSLNTSTSQTVSEALSTRITVRDFLDTPVPSALLREILEKAMRSPSGGNLQPWKLHVMTGDTLAEFKKRATERTLAGKTEEPTYPAYPSPLWEPQRSWRYKLGEDMYKLIGIAKDDKMARLAWLARNADFFNAPVGIIITGNKKLNMPQYMDIGILLQSLMLLAREAGLHTAPQGWWRNWSSVCHEILTIPDEEEVLVGMAMGYGNPDKAVNSLYADRAELDQVSQFYD
ncbi:nitroreductase [Litorimonas taeanensis]|uniref:Nitroreductase n=1 Tax=Litorimonas taeanensis TaxID=568099 RepID=A0A420WLI8_9PROT|nr:nitroreductase [Litorimonas taeanensis]RKQ71911.1 nitroreductase [Litorimonas taeanensis]